MRARRLIDTASYDQEAVKVMGEAFDQAWRDIAGNFGTGGDRDAARLKLANALLSVANNDCRDVLGLKRAALIAMARSYRVGQRS